MASGHPKCMGCGTVHRAAIASYWELCPACHLVWAGRKDATTYPGHPTIREIEAIGQTGVDRVALATEMMARIISDSPLTIDHAHRIGIALAQGTFYDGHRREKRLISFNDTHIIVHRDEYMHKTERVTEDEDWITGMDRGTWFHSISLVQNQMDGWRSCQNPLYVTNESSHLHLTALARGSVLMGSALNILARDLVHMVELDYHRSGPAFERLVALPVADFIRVAAGLFTAHRTAISALAHVHLPRVLVSLLETFLFHPATLK